MTIAGQLSLMRFIGAPQEHEDNLQYIYIETKTAVIASVLWASVLQCIRPLRWLPAYSLEYPKGRLENRLVVSLYGDEAGVFVGARFLHK